MSITKNHQSAETLHALARAAFPEKAVRQITELTEGMFNAAYRFDFADGSASILKVAAATSEGLLSNEINMMQAEVAAMDVARKHGLPGVARVQFSDFTCTRCSGPCFFMEALPGRSLNSCRAELAEDVQVSIMRDVGRFQRRMADIHGERFCLLGDSNRFNTLHGLVVYMFRNVLRDAAARSVSFPIAPDDILALLEHDHAIFDEVAAPSFVHWDMWEGNIFVTDDRFTGVIDWERAMWADPLMDDRFRRHSRQAAFLEGYGQTVFTAAQTRRILWYDVFLYLTMITECAYRQYDGTPEPWAWLPPLLVQSWAELNA